MSTGTEMAVEWGLRQILDRRGDSMSLSELSRRTGISYTTIHAIASGTTQRVDLKTIDALCEALDVTPAELLVYSRPKRRARA